MMNYVLVLEERDSQSWFVHETWRSLSHDMIQTARLLILSVLCMLFSILYR
jgi:hypothetical protein